MSHNTHLIAQYAQLAMILEVCATPKPGNVDRDHNYPDTHFEHFLASAVSVYPVLKKASADNKDIGKYIHEAVVESAKWQSGGNTHFGAFILLIPLVMAAGKLRTQMNGGPGIFPELEQCVMELVKDTSADDSVELYKAFSKAGVRINDVDDLDLADLASIDEIRSRRTTLYQLMEISSSYDMIAREWTTGFQLTFRCADSILGKYRSMSINDTLVRTFLEILAENPDTFIRTKFDLERAKEVSGRALHIVDCINSSGFEIAKPDIEQFDEQLLSEGINPGSTADIIIAGLFVALIGGLKF
ncbi:MAG: triphosphoribosyl-dephospho-CoA synthase [Methanosarcinales archaeon]|nr:triphosphoribosyl-dephospho-CoA synthase [Methanosarcinales archaeon]